MDAKIWGSVVEVAGFPLTLDYLDLLEFSLRLSDVHNKLKVGV